MENKEITRVNTIRECWRPGLQNHIKCCKSVTFKTGKSSCLLFESSVCSHTEITRYRVKCTCLAWRPGFRSSAALFPALAPCSRWCPLAAVIRALPGPRPLELFPFLLSRVGSCVPQLKRKSRHPPQLRDNRGPGWADSPPDAPHSLLSGHQAFPITGEPAAAIYHFPPSVHA